MSMRYLPPAYSPVSAGSLAGSLRGLALGGPAGVDEWLARRWDVDAALLLDSGTSALRLAIQSLATATSPRVRVALPAYACYDLATAALGAGAGLTFYDLDPATLGPDWSSFSTVLAAGVDAVVLVHQFGIPVDLDRARALADAHGALVIEDAAQGAGAWWRHRRLGARGDLGVLSFGRGKGMTAGGGGALLSSGTRGRQLLEQARARVAAGGRGTGSFARLAAQALLSHPMLYGVPARLPWLALGDTPFHEPWAPRAIDAAQAGVLESAATLADIEAGSRRTQAIRLIAALEDIEDVALVTPPVGDGNLPGWLRFPVVLGAAARARAGQSPFRQLGIMPGYPRPLPELPQLSVAAGARGSWPGATRLAAALTTLPTHRWVAATDMDAAVALLRG
jgi:perosamine synthetase